MKNVYAVGLLVASLMHVQLVTAAEAKTEVKTEGKKPVSKVISLRVLPYRFACVERRPATFGGKVTTYFDQDTEMFATAITDENGKKKECFLACLWNGRDASVSKEKAIETYESFESQWEKERQKSK